jgi:hypothetical protein
MAADNNAGKSVAQILDDKKASIKNAPLEPGSPSWNDILDMTWEDVVERAKKREPGYKTFKKLFSQGEYNK